MKNQASQSRKLRYLFGTMIVGLAVMITHLVWPQPAIANDTFLIAAVMVSAWYGGLGAALLATFLAGFATVFVVMPPGYEFSVGADDVPTLALFLFISILGGSLHAHSRRAAHEASAARDAANIADSAKGQFLAMVSHELRTPLNPILMTATALEKDARLPKEVLDDLKMIRRNAELEARLVDDLLDVVRIGKGKLSVKLASVRAHDLVRMVVAICRDEVCQKQLELRVQTLACNDCIFADSTRMQQILWNLLRNAIKFTPEGGLISITTSNDVIANLVVEVADTGIGLDPRQCQEVFNPFEQGGREVAAQLGGLGLGLTIAKVLAEAQGGTISLSSEGRGQGVKVRVELPTVSASNDLQSTGGHLSGGYSRSIPSASQEFRGCYLGNP